MRIFPAFTFIVLFALKQGYSQDYPLKKTSLFLEFSAGPTSTTFYGSEIDDRLDSYYSPEAYIEPRKGYAMNLNAKITFLKYWFIRPGVLYIQKGGEEMNSRFRYNFKGELDYISVPLLIGFQPLNFDNTKRLNVYAQAGVVPNFLVSRKNDNMEMGYAYKPNLNSSSMSYQLGAGLEFAITSRIAVSGTYSYFKDFTSFFNFLGKDAYHKGSFITGGLMYRLDRKFQPKNED